MGRVMTRASDSASDDMELSRLESGLFIGANGKDILEEILNKSGCYFALFHAGLDNGFYIADLNKKAGQVEHVDKKEVVGKCIDNTPLASRKKLVELLHHLHVTNESHKLAVSEKGDDSEGYYMGFILTPGNYVVEPESCRRIKNELLFEQSDAFEKMSNMLPEMIYEVDLNGKILFANEYGLNFFGYTEKDLETLMISDIFPMNYSQMISNMVSLKSPDDFSSNEYYGRKKDGSLFQLSPIPLRSSRKAKSQGTGEPQRIFPSKKIMRSRLREKKHSLNT